MKKDSFIKNQVVIAAVSVIAVTSFIAFQTSVAAPILAPPDGNPAFPQGPQGPQGGGGNQGNQGNQGSQGPTGPQGPDGSHGIGLCYFNTGQPTVWNGWGSSWISHGWDGGCAWQTGIWFFCNGQRLTRFTSQNGCGTAGTP